MFHEPSTSGYMYIRRNGWSRHVETRGSISMFVPLGGGDGGRGAGVRTHRGALYVLRSPSHLPSPPFAVPWVWRLGTGSPHSYGSRGLGGSNGEFLLANVIIIIIVVGPRSSSSSFLLQYPRVFLRPRTSYGLHARSYPSSFRVSPRGVQSSRARFTANTVV